MASLTMQDVKQKVVLERTTFLFYDGFRCKIFRQLLLAFQ